MSLVIRAGDGSNINVLSVTAGAANWLADKKVYFITAGGGNNMCLFDRRSSNSRRTLGSRLHLHSGGEEWLAIKQQYNEYDATTYQLKDDYGYDAGVFQVSGFEIVTEKVTTSNRSWSITGLKPESIWKSGTIPPGGSGIALYGNNFMFSSLIGRSDTSVAKYVRLYIDGDLVQTVAANQYWAVAFAYVGKVNKTSFTVQVVCDSGIVIGAYVGIAGVRIVS